MRGVSSYIIADLVSGQLFRGGWRDIGRIRKSLFAILAHF